MMNTENPVKCVKCDSQATWIVNESPHCAYHVAAWARWCLDRDGCVSKWYNELGFTYNALSGYVPIKESEHG